MSADSNLPKAEPSGNEQFRNPSSRSLCDQPELLVKPLKYSYETVPGFFCQTDASEVFPFADILTSSFGMIDTFPERWQNLDKAIKSLNSSAPEGVKYKVVFMGRHGQSYGNLASKKYSKEEWRDKWRHETTDGEITWGPDPSLTSTGEGQAKDIRNTWKREVLSGAPASPEMMKWYASPLTRAGQTLLISFEDMLGDAAPTVLESLREIIGVNTCDKRSTKTAIQGQFPTFKFCEGFTEEDELWTANDRETDESMQKRALEVLDHIFDNDTEIYVSSTGHSRMSRNMRAALKHAPYPLLHGEMIPMVIKASRLSSEVA